MSWISRVLISPRTEFGLRLRRGLYLGVLGVAFILLYVVDFAFSDLSTDVPRFLLPLVLVAALAVSLLARDSLKYPGAACDRHVTFFQAQLPRVYIEERYGLPQPEARNRWLRVLRQWRDRGHPNHRLYASSLRRSYECRLVYYLLWLLPRGFLLCVLALVVLACLTWAADLDLSSAFTLRNSGLAAVRIAFPLFLLGLYLYLRLGHRPDPSEPTGVWLRWKEINDRLKAWWDLNEGR